MCNHMHDFLLFAALIWLSQPKLRDVAFSGFIADAIYDIMQVMKHVVHVRLFEYHLDSRSCPHKCNFSYILCTLQLNAVLPASYGSYHTKHFSFASLD